MSILRPTDFGCVPNKTDKLTMQNNTLGARAMATAGRNGYHVSWMEDQDGFIALSKPPGDTQNALITDSVGMNWHFGGGGYNSPAIAFDNSLTANDALLQIQP